VRWDKLRGGMRVEVPPGQVVADRPEPSLAGVAVTRGLKRRQEAYRVWEASLESQ